ncbi:hypothetical protein QTO34_011427 [Cnephaeus nilssonii]|uniref:Large ribosomal subunit protein uL22 n=1 Tax=Cnephaeus nilssonii TaxID=3371016 RepID=A0AA40HEB5_CNENI|nr:hypothetical protein QTO34_011427 [Eptesicus nilssonii]
MQLPAPGPPETQKQYVPFRHYNGGVGRCVQAKRSTELLLNVLKNAERNAELQGRGAEFLVIEHIQVNKAPKMRGRAYRVHA